MTASTDLRVEVIGYPVINPTEEGLAEAVARVRCPDCAGRVELDVSADLPVFRRHHDETCPTWATVYGQEQTRERARARRERKAKYRRKAARTARKRRKP